MLILYRKTGDGILIGDNVRITVVETSSGGVRLAIDAPRDITVIREELAMAAEVNEDSVLPSLPSLDSVHLLQEALEKHHRKNESAP